MLKLSRYPFSVDTGEQTPGTRLDNRVTEYFYILYYFYYYFKYKVKIF
jgi:hypothetical protein